MEASIVRDLNYHNEGETWYVVAVACEDDAPYLHRVLKYIDDYAFEYEGKRVILSGNTAVMRLV